MSKGLEALNEIQNELYGHYDFKDISDYSKEQFENIEKELKEKELAIDFIDRIADLFGTHDLEELEDKIIKQKKAFETIRKKLPPLMQMAVLDYCNKEEFDLLKEVLL